MFRGIRRLPAGGVAVVLATAGVQIAGCGAVIAHPSSGTNTGAGTETDTGSVTQAPASTATTGSPVLELLWTGTALVLMGVACSVGQAARTRGHTTT
jgi:hypothetical protein